MRAVSTLRELLPQVQRELCQMGAVAVLLASGVSRTGSSGTGDVTSAGTCAAGTMSSGDGTAGDLVASDAQGGANARATNGAGGPVIPEAGSAESEWFRPHSARFVRFNQLAAGGDDWWSIRELEVEP